MLKESKEQKNILTHKERKKKIKKIINMHDFLVMNAHAHSYSCKAALNFLIQKRENDFLKQYFSMYHDYVEEYINFKLMNWESSKLEQLKTELHKEIELAIPRISFEFVRERLNSATKELGLDPESEYTNYFKAIDKFNKKDKVKFQSMLEEKILLEI